MFPPRTGPVNKIPPPVSVWHHRRQKTISNGYEIAYEGKNIMLFFFNSEINHPEWLFAVKNEKKKGLIYIIPQTTYPPHDSDMVTDKIIKDTLIFAAKTEEGCKKIFTLLCSSSTSVVMSPLWSIMFSSVTQQ